jgi:DMATS type aromatic prenyltransferase
MFRENWNCQPMRRALLLLSISANRSRSSTLKIAVFAPMPSTILVIIKTCVWPGRKRGSPMSKEPQQQGAEKSAQKELVVSDFEGNLYFLPPEILAASKIPRATLAAATNDGSGRSIEDKIIDALNRAAPLEAPAAQAKSPDENLLGFNTAFDFGTMQLQKLCDATGFSNRRKEMLNLFQELSRLCNDRDLNLPPRWSGVGDDCTPFEFSIEIQEARSSIRFLVEAQDDPASPKSYWDAGIRINEWLAQNWQIDLKRFKQIGDLFVPTSPAVYAAVGHGIGFRKDGPPLFKIYLNPMAQGVKNSESVISEALSRLGFSHAAPTLLAMRGPNDLFSHFSLDLSNSPEARVKVYIKRFNPTFDELDERCAAIDSTTRGKWSYFCKAILGDQSSLTRRPVYTSYHLIAETPNRPRHTVLHLPVLPYINNDQTAHDRIVGFLDHCGLPSELYSRSVSAFTRGPLALEQGLHSHVSYQCEMGRPRVTIYFGSRAYFTRYGWLSLAPERNRPENCWPSPVRS